MMITLFGATGHTGRLVAHTLERRHLPFRLAGRSAEKLARLSAELASRPQWLVADAARPETLPPMVRDTRVVINCAGPFTDLGEAVVNHAVMAGVRYLDTTNELAYVCRLQAYEALARRTGAAIVPACAFEVALADCAAAVLARRLALAEVTAVDIIYALGGLGSSGGTRRSAVRALATSWLGYRDGRRVGELPGSRIRGVYLPQGWRPAVAFPSSEIVTIPAHIRTRQVTVWMTTTGIGFFWMPLLAPCLAWLARGPLGRPLAALASLIGLPPESGRRSVPPFIIQVELLQGKKRHKLILAGKGVYDITAEIVAYAAEQMLAPAYDLQGVLPPARALCPQALLTEAGDYWGVQVTQTVE